MNQRFIGGTVVYSVDAKGRVNVPAKFRKALTDAAIETLYIRKAPNNTLWVYPEDEWQKVAQKLEELPKTEKNMRYYRMVYRSIAETTIDAQGRIVVPPKLLAHANIEKKLAITGMGPYFEIVCPDILEEDEEDFDALFYEAEGV